MTVYTPAQWQEAIAALGSAGGGATSVADGANVAEGTTTDAAVTNPASAATLVALLKGLLTNTADLLADGDFLTTIAANTTGASTSAKQDTGNTSLASIKTDVDTLTTSGGGGYVRQDSTATIAKESGGNLATIVTNTNKLIAPSINSGTIDATTQRTVAGGAATGTKSNVASSASSVTILASNTSRKGAMAYNDSTQILYLDLSGGTASSSSYSTQVSAQSMFELPGPNLYNGAITGIWASANGNARVTEWT